MVDLEYEAAFIPLDVKLQRDFESISPFFKQKHTIVNLDVHSDGSPFLGKNVIQNNYAFTIKSEFLTTNKNLNARARPYLLIIGEEKKRFFKTYNYLNGILIGDAITQKYCFKNGKTVEVRLRYIDGDNKAIWAILGNKCGGNKRCWSCTAPFDNQYIHNNLFIHEFLKYKRKSLKENFLFFLNAFKKKLTDKEIRTKAEEIGLSSSPYFAEALFYSFNLAGKDEKEFLDALEQIIVGVDNLHNIRGWILHFISSLKENKRLNEKKYHSLLKEHGLSPDDSSGGKLRLLILNFEKIIIPSLVYDKSNQSPITEKIRTVLSIFQTIVWISYSPEEAQSYDGIKLLLRYKCYELACALQGLNELKLVDLYLHVILSHFPDFFDDHSFYIVSTEPLEGLFVTTKRCKHSTNRHKRNILKKIIKRFENINLRDIVLGDTYLESITRTEKGTNNKFSGYRSILKELQDVWIEQPLQSDHSLLAQQTRAFLGTVLGNPHYKDNVVLENGRICLKMRDDIHRYFENQKEISIN